MADTYSVALMYDGQFETHCHPMAVGVEKCVAKSIYRHFQKIIYRLGLWSDYSQTGYYMTMNSQTWCLNHADFEEEYGTAKARIEEINKLWEERGVEDATLEPEWEEYEYLLEADAEVQAMLRGGEAYV